MTEELGHLEFISAREVWQHEAHEFTPWLFENPDRLAEALGIELEFDFAEHSVGDFSLDLIGRDITHDAVLIVENQLEPTDHAHLGQLLTYTAGTNAATIVWIAPRFREEHRQALDWLNESTGDDARFFGVEVTIARIGDSAPAPHFRLAAQPNDWTKHVRAAAGASKASGKGALYVEFWGLYLDRVQEVHPDWTRRRHPPIKNWLEITSPLRGTFVNPSFAQGGRMRHELYIDSEDKDRNKAFFHAVLERRSEVEGVYGCPLEWEELPDGRASRIAEYREDSDVSITERHDEYVAWFIDCGERMRRVLDWLPPEVAAVIEGDDAR